MNFLLIIPYILMMVKFKIYVMFGYVKKVNWFGDAQNDGKVNKIITNSHVNFPFMLTWAKIVNGDDIEHILRKTKTL